MRNGLSPASREKVPSGKRSTRCPRASAAMISSTSSTLFEASKRSTKSVPSARRKAWISGCATNSRLATKP
ncbi:MAG: hypothetical protein AW07_00328 [Candidatus Accumulibacter sp. SK-11]|nr:MAG: hypothetical protein AW07_00328 [Candidatus Accumulibacter sp. SK-11]